MQQPAQRARRRSARLSNNRAVSCPPEAPQDDPAFAVLSLVLPHLLIDGDYDDLTSAQLVCRHWRDQLRADMYKLRMTLCTAPTGGWRRFAELPLRLPALRQLHVHIGTRLGRGAGNRLQAALPTLMALPKLEELRLTFHAPRFPKYGFLPQVGDMEISTDCHLTALVVDGCPLPDEAIKELLLLLGSPHLSGLRRLEITPSPTPYGRSQFEQSQSPAWMGDDCSATGLVRGSNVKLLAQLEQLEHLKFRCQDDFDVPEDVMYPTSEDEDDPLDSIDYLMEMPKLKSLGLTGDGISLDRLLQQQAHRLTRLECPVLLKDDGVRVSMELTDEVLGRMGAQVEANAQLQELHLKFDNQLPDCDWLDALADSKLAPRLVGLDITSASAAVQPAPLAALTGLTSLTLHRLQQGETPTPPLLAGLSVLTALQVLDLQLASPPLAPMRRLGNLFTANGRGEARVAQSLLMAWAPRLRSLSLRDWAPVNCQQGLQHLSCLTGLTQLTLQAVAMMGSSGKLQWAGIDTSWLPVGCLASLQLRGMQVDCTRCKGGRQVPSSLAGLSYLSLSQCHMMADRRLMHVTTLGQLLGGFTTLTELELSGMCQLTDANMEALGRLRKLTDLSIRQLGGNVSNCSLQAVSSLTRLKLLRWQVGDYLDMLPEMMCGLGSLTRLMLLSTTPRNHAEMERWRADSVISEVLPSCDVHIEMPA